MRSVVTLIAVLATSGCQLFTGPDLAERLLGQYEVVHIRGTPVPGWFRTCWGWTSCDSIYYAGAELEFEAGGRCRFQVTTAEITRQTCSWQTNGDEAEMRLAGGDLSRVTTNDLEAGYITVVFREGCPDLDFDPCGQDWWVFRRKGTR